MGDILKIKNCDISETVWPIIMKFCTMTHIIINLYTKHELFIAGGAVAPALC